MPQDRWIQIYTAHDALEAHVVASALEHAGIDVRLLPPDSSGFGAALPTLDRAPTVWVRADDEGRARALIDNAGDSEVGRLSFTDSPAGRVSEAHSPTTDLDEDD